MGTKKLKLLPRTILYYTQPPPQELVTLLCGLFQYGPRNTPEQQNLRLIKWNYKNRYRETFILAFEDKIYYVKRFYPLTFKEKFKYMELFPRAHKCFTLSQRLIKSGFQIPKPVLALSYRRKPFCQDSIFVNEKYDGISLEDMMKSEIDVHVKHEVMHNFARTIGTFYRKGFIQTDPNLENFLLDISTGENRIAFIDIDQTIL